MMDTEALLNKQRKFFETGATLPLSFRIDMLKRLRAAVAASQDALGEALRADLGKSAMEGFMCETGLVMGEISYLLRHIRFMARRRRVITPLPQTFSRCYVEPAPLGNVLIMSPWNYPVLLTLTPLADAIAAGDTAIVKPSAYSPATSEALAKLVRDTFPEEYIAVVTGGRAENRDLLSQRYDLMFFTGSQAVGKLVMQSAAEHLTPVVLELGGKSPCIVDETADISLAARRIVWGKFLNLGQTCVAPDYILCQRGVKDALIEALRREIIRQFGEKPLGNQDYGMIVNEKHMERIRALIDPDKVVHGGGVNAARRQIEPTVMDDVSWDDAVMGQEIFGPVLPVLSFDRVEELPGLLADRPKPLACYVFSKSRANIDLLTGRLRFGGGCVNDVVIHLTVPGMAFGGVGESGMGGYHGRDGFKAFSHEKSIVDKKLFLDLPMRYQPFKKVNEKLLHMFLR